MELLSDSCSERVVGGRGARSGRGIMMLPLALFGAAAAGAGGGDGSGLPARFLFSQMTAVMTQINFAINIIYGTGSIVNNQSNIGLIGMSLSA